MSNNASFLKEMGITEWTSRDAIQAQPEASIAINSQAPQREPQASPKASNGIWWFFGDTPQGDTQILFQNLIRVLGLAKNEWSWMSPSVNLSQLAIPGLSVVAVAFGGSVAQKITGEKDSLPQLRETVLALNSGNEDEIPVIATFELNQVLTKPKEKAMLWQDLLMAKSVMQNI